MFILIYILSLENWVSMIASWIYWWVYTYCTLYYISLVLHLIKYYLNSWIRRKSIFKIFRYFMSLSASNLIQCSCPHLRGASNMNFRHSDSVITFHLEAMTHHPPQAMGPLLCNEGCWVTAPMRGVLIESVVQHQPTILVGVKTIPKSFRTSKHAL